MTSISRASVSSSLREIATKRVDAGSGRANGPMPKVLAPAAFLCERSDCPVCHAYGRFDVFGTAPRAVSDGSPEKRFGDVPLMKVRCREWSLRVELLSGACERRRRGSTFERQSQFKDVAAILAPVTPRLDRAPYQISSVRLI